MGERSLTLKALVNARLTAAAEEIFALVERTIAEYEEELCRSKEENQRKQRLLDSVLKTQLHTTEGVQTDFSPESRVKQEIPEPAPIKEEPEEQRLKQEEEPLPEFTAVCVKSEEQPSLLQQRQHRDLTQGEQCGGANISLHPHGHFPSETEEQSDNEEDWEPPACSSTAQMETKAHGGHYKQVQIKDTSTAAHSVGLCGAESRATVTEGHGSGTGGGGGGAGGGKYECNFCHKKLKSNNGLEVHIRTHTGEKPHSCSVCKKAFAFKSNLKIHLRIHTGERPYSCSYCDKSFIQREHFKVHMRNHTGERPFSCPICKNAYTNKTSLNFHMRSHR